MENTGEVKEKTAHELWQEYGDSAVKLGDAEFKIRVLTEQIEHLENEGEMLICQMKIAMSKHQALVLASQAPPQDPAESPVCGAV